MNKLWIFLIAMATLFITPNQINSSPPDELYIGGLTITYVAAAQWGFTIKAFKSGSWSNGCTATGSDTDTWYMLWSDANNDPALAMYSTAMAAYLTGKTVNLWGLNTNTCDGNGIQLYKIYSL